MKDKLKELINNFPDYVNGEKVDGAFIVSPINRLYFSKFKSSAGYIFVTRDKNYLIIDFRYYEAAIKSVKNMSVVLLSDFKDIVKNIINRHNLKNILIENDGITLSQALYFENLFNENSAKIIKTNILDKMIKRLRSIKSDDEIENIKIAQKISENAFNKILSIIRPGMTEKEIAINLEFLIKKEGADNVSFDLIVVSGRNSAVPHASPSNKIIEYGDFITIDMGAIYNGYCSDMTRTVAVKQVTNEQKEIYDIVLKAQNEAIKYIKPGISCKKLDKIARDIIDKNGYNKYFGHGLGHGVGLEIHESPNVSTGSNDMLKPGMVITIEPGIYIQNKFGVRIEDLVIVTENGCENLTYIDKNLLIL